MLDPLAMAFCDPQFVIDHVAQRDGAHQDDNFGVYDLDLPFEVRQAFRSFLNGWVSVFRRMALYNIPNVDVLISVKTTSCQNFI